MYCTNCGAFVIDGQAFCTPCGEKLTDTPVQASADASAAGSAAPSPVPSAGVSAQPSNAYAYGAPAAQNPPQPAASYSYGSAAPQQPAAGYGYAPAAQQPAQGYAYGAQPAQSYAYTAAPQQPAQNYIYGPDDTRTPAFNWERLQPRSHPAGAGALIFALGILFAAVLMIVWGTAFLSPGGLGSDEAIVSEETKKPSGGKKETTAADDSTKEDSTKASKEETTDKATEAPTEASTKAPVQEAAPGELPASVAAKVKKNASREDYYGNYTGTLTVDTYNLKKLAETMGAPSDQMDMYEALKEGRIGGYASDVMENELAGSGLTGNDEFASPLFECDNFIITPHLGAQSEDAARDVGIYITGKVKSMLNLNLEEL